MPSAGHPSEVRVDTRLIVDSGSASDTSTGSWGGALLALPDSRRSPKVGPETAEPVKTPSTHLTLMTKEVAATTTRGIREDQRGQGQEISPSLNITMGHDISQGRNETPGPSIPSTLRNRRTHASCH